MLREKFGPVVHWVLSPEKQCETWRRVFGRALGQNGADAQLEQLRGQYIRDQATRAVERTWDKAPEQRRAFIDSEMASGCVFPVTADEIFDYSEKHFRALLPKHIDLPYEPN